jgi:hypothetical protein
LNHCNVGQIIKELRKTFGGLKAQQGGKRFAKSDIFDA